MLCRVWKIIVQVIPIACCLDGINMEGTSNSITLLRGVRWLSAAQSNITLQVRCLRVKKFVYRGVIRFIVEIGSDGLRVSSAHGL